MKTTNKEFILTYKEMEELLSALNRKDEAERSPYINLDYHKIYLFGLFNDCAEAASRLGLTKMGRMWYHCSSVYDVIGIQREDTCVILVNTSNYTIQHRRDKNASSKMNEVQTYCKDHNIPTMSMTILY